LVQSSDKVADPAIEIGRAAGDIPEPMPGQEGTIKPLL